MTYAQNLRKFTDSKRVACVSENSLKGVARKKQMVSTYPAKRALALCSAPYVASSFAGWVDGAGTGRT